MANSNNEQPKPGEFPFPLLDSSEESTNVRWIRNNARYLQLSGILNILQAFGTYIRGVIGNILIITPVLVLLGIAIARLHFWMLDNPFLITKVLTATAISGILLYFAARSSKTSLFENDFYQGLFSQVLALALFLLFAATLFEVSPHIIEIIRGNSLFGEYFETFGFREVGSILVGGASGAGVLLRFLPESNSIRRSIMLFLLSVVGFVLMWTIVLCIANYVSYGLPPHDFYIFLPLILITCLLACCLAFVVFSKVFGAPSDSSGLSAKIPYLFFHSLAVLGLLGLIFLTFYNWQYLGVKRIFMESELAGAHIETITRPLVRLINVASENESLRPVEPSTQSGCSCGGPESIQPCMHCLGTGNFDAIQDGLSDQIKQQKKQSDTLSEFRAVAKHSPFYQQNRWYSSLLKDLKSTTAFEPDYFETAANLVESSQCIFEDLDEAQRSAFKRQLNRKTKEIVFNLIFDEMKSVTGGGMTKESLGRALIAETILLHLRNKFAEKFQRDQFSLLSQSAESLNNKYINEWLGDVNKWTDRFSLANIDNFCFQCIAESSIDVGSVKYDFEHCEIKKTIANALLEAFYAEGKTPSQRMLNAVSGFKELQVDKPIFTKKPTRVVQDGSSKAPELKNRLNKLIFNDFFDLRSNKRFEEIVSDAFIGLPQRKSLELEKRLGLEVNYLKEIETDPDSRKFQRAARMILAQIALGNFQDFDVDEQAYAIEALGELYQPHVPTIDQVKGEGPEEKKRNVELIALQTNGHSLTTESTKSDLGALTMILAHSFLPERNHRADQILRRMAIGRYGNLQGIDKMSESLHSVAVTSKTTILFAVAIILFLIGYYFVDVNSTSLHAFYRDRLANTFLICDNPTHNSCTVDTDLALTELCEYENLSIAPYHIFNAALNLRQGEANDVRSRNADFFVFTKHYIGSERTKYVTTQEFQKQAPEMSVATAMAISGAAAASNMGKYSNGILSFFLTILNVRLGYWLPNPKFIRVTNQAVEFERVFAREILELELRREGFKNYANSVTNRFPDLFKSIESRSELKSRIQVQGLSSAADPTAEPSTEYRLLGLCLSGGGIRSASLNLGILQALQKTQLFYDVDYLSTVSGGGYIGTAVSSYMHRLHQDLTPSSPNALAVNGQQRLVNNEPFKLAYRTIWGRLRRHSKWLPRSTYLFRELFSNVGQRSRLINVSDGGHIENLGAYELLRRRCEVIIVGDGEADPKGVLDGLSCLMRLADIDMGIKIKFRENAFDFTKPEYIEDSEREPRHFEIGKIIYPATGTRPAEYGYMLYFKSTYQGNEDQVIKGYRAVHEKFPHDSTADQIFDEPQFEVYRRLGELIATEFLGADSNWNYNSLYNQLKSETDKFAPTPSLATRKRPRRSK